VTPQLDCSSALPRRFFRRRVTGVVRSASPEGARQGQEVRWDDPGSYAVCTISFDDPNSDAATYRVVEYGYETAEQAFRGLDRLKKSRGCAKVDLVVMQHVDRDAER
jgi:hypothetical protein